MSGTYQPKKPVGQSAMWTWRRWIWDKLQGGALIDGSDPVIVTHSDGVYHITAKPSRSGGGKVSGLNFRGEYDPTAAYNVNDVVVIRAGSNAGSYVCIQGITATDPQLPDTGNLYWISLSGNAPSMGAWMTPPHSPG